MANLSRIFKGVGTALSGTAEALKNADEQRKKSKLFEMQLEQSRMQKESLEFNQAIQRIDFAKNLPSSERKKYFSSEGNGRQFLNKAFGGPVSDEVANYLATPQGSETLGELIGFFPDIIGLPDDQKEQVKKILSDRSTREDPAVTLNALERVMTFAEKAQQARKTTAEINKLNAESKIAGPRGKFLQTKVDRVEKRIEEALKENPNLTREQLLPQVVNDSGFKGMDDYNRTLQEIGGDSENIKDSGGARINPSAPKRESELRQEFEGNKKVKDFDEVAAFHSQIQESLSSNTRAAEIASVYNLFKILDPGGRVTQNEVITIDEVPSAAQRFVGVYNNLIKGKARLTPEIREQIRAVAENAYQKQKTRFDSFASGYKKIAKEQGLDPNNIILPRGSSSAKGDVSAFDDLLPEQ